MREILSINIADNLLAKGLKVQRRKKRMLLTGRGPNVTSWQTFQSLPQKYSENASNDRIFIRANRKTTTW